MPFLGKADAPLTLVMFTDYQCPFCSRFETQTLPEIKKQYIDTGKLRFVVRDLPLPFHPNAPKAAEAAHCAEEQGKYWELREKLVNNGDKLDAKLLPDYAKQVGLDVEQVLRLPGERPPCREGQGQRRPGRDDRHLRHTQFCGGQIKG